MSKGRAGSKGVTGRSERIEPFKTPSLHPRRRARNVAGKEVEQRSDANPDGAARRRQMLSDEKLLLGIAHRHEQDIGFGAANALDNLGELARVEMAVLTTDDRLLWA